MKLVLVNPLWTLRNVLPINLAELAGHIRQCKDHQVSILDLNYELRKHLLSDDIIHKALDLLNAHQPDIVGLTCNTIHVPFCVEFARAYKKNYKAPLVLGGIHPTFQPERMLRLTGADYLIRGEGEETLRELLQSIGRRRSLAEVRGLSYRDRQRIRHNPDRPLMPDLSKLAFPAFDLLLPYVRSIHKEKRPGDRTLEMQLCATRGCPYGCIFCSAHTMWKYQRRKPIERVVQEIAYVRTQYKQDYIEFGDDCLPLNKAWFGRLLAEIEKARVRWSCLSRIDILDPRLLRKMRDAGCDSIYHGLESGSPRIRALLNKRLRPGVTNSDIAALVAYETQLGIRATCSFMVGIPTETAKDIRGTIDFACQLKERGATTQLWVMTPFPDTEAAHRYRDRLVRIDRWKLLRQSDVNMRDQFYLYNKFFERYHKHNPDRYLFRPEMAMRDFVRLYRQGKQRLEPGYYHESRLYNYVREAGARTYFIGLRQRLPIGVSQTAGRQIPFIRIRNGDFFDSSRALIQRLKRSRVSDCLVSIDIPTADRNRLKQDILVFLRSLKENKIRFALTRPAASWGASIDTAGFFAPAHCEDCYELFKVNRSGEIELCNGLRLFKETYADTRALIYDFFISTGALLLNEKKSGTLCSCFPQDKKHFQLLEKRWARGRHCIKKAQKHFRDGNIRGCMRSIQEAAAVGCAHDMIHLLSGFCHEKNKAYTKALAELRIAERIYPHSPQVSFSLLNCYRHLGKARAMGPALQKVYTKLKDRGL